MFNIFLIPSIIWLDAELSKHNGKISSLFLILFIILLISLVLTTFELNSYYPYYIEYNYSETHSVLAELLANRFIKLLLISLHLSIFVWVITLIFCCIKNRIFPIPPQVCIIATYAIFMSYLLKNPQVNIYYINILINLILLNSLSIALYYIFKIDSLSKQQFTIPLYMILFGIIITLYNYLTHTKLSNITLLYISMQFAIILVLLFYNRKFLPSTNLDDFHYIGFFVCFAFLINCCISYFSIISNNTSEYSLFSVFGSEILCCVIAFLFRIINVRNKLVTKIVLILSCIIVLMSVVRSIFFLVVGYELLIKVTSWQFQFYSAAFIVSMISASLLILMLLVQGFVDLFSKTDTKLLQKVSV